MQITGASSAEHGVYANGPFDPLGKNNRGWYWYAEDIKVPTLWQAVSAKGGVTASVSWPVTVGATGITYNIPEYGPQSADLIKLISALSRPEGFLAELQRHLGPYIKDDSEKGDEVRVKYAVEILKRYKPQFMTVHLLAVDHASHAEGPFSKEANAALERVDGLISELEAAASATDKESVIAVVSDHGFSSIDRVLNLPTAFVNAGLLELSPAIPNAPRVVISWKAGISNGGGSAGIILKDPRDLKTREQVGALLRQLKADPGNGIARVLEGDELTRLGAWPNASYVVDMQSNYAIGSSLVGPLVESVHGGQHGFLATDPDMRAVFLIKGAPIAKGRRLGVIDMRQIAPTIAAILGVSLPSAVQQALDVTVHASPLPTSR